VANKSLTENGNRIAELNTEVGKIPGLEQQIDEKDLQKQEVEKQLRQTQTLLDNELRKKENATVGVGDNNVIYEDQATQTEAEYTGLDGTAAEAQNEGAAEYASQQTSVQHQNQLMQQQNMNMVLSQQNFADSQSMFMMRNNPMQMGHGYGSASHQGLGMTHGGITPKTHQLNQLQLNQASHLNISNPNMRQATGLGKGGPNRIQSAVHTAQSTTFATRQGAGGMQHMLMSQGYQTAAGLSSQGAAPSQDGQTRNSRGQINRTIPADRDSRSVDGKAKYNQGSLAT